MANGHGGAREGGGRKPGIPNKSTAEIKALAQQYAPAVIAMLAELASTSDNPTARIAAGKELLDRAYGKSVQPQSGPDGESNPVIEVLYRWAKQEEAE